MSFGFWFYSCQKHHNKNNQVGVLLDLQYSSGFLYKKENILSRASSNDKRRLIKFLPNNKDSQNIKRNSFLSGSSDDGSCDDHQSDDPPCVIFNNIFVSYLQSNLKKFEEHFMQFYDRKRLDVSRSKPYERKKCTKINVN